MMNKHRVMYVATAALIAALTLGLLILFTPRHDASATEAVTGEAPAWLVDLAKSTAATNADAAPTAAEWGFATMEQALPLLEIDATETPLPLDKEYYFVVLKGDFVATNAFYPPEAKAPEGTFMVLTVDAETRNVAGFSLAREVPAADATTTWLNPLYL